MAQSTSGNSSRKHANRDSASLTTREPRDRVNDKVTDRVTAIDGDHDTTCSIRGEGGDSEERETLRQRELEEAKGRAAQMEKTMRWWSDCTASWREKWSKVRTERNQARDECKLLKTKLEASLEESTLNKREKEELALQNEQLKSEMEKVHLLLLKHGENFESTLLEGLGDDPSKHFAFSNGQNDSLTNQNSLECDTTATLESELARKLENRDSMSPKSGKSTPKSDKTSPKTSSLGTNGTNTLNGTKNGVDEEFFKQKLAKLQLQLDETSKNLLMEKEEKVILIENITSLTDEIADLKEKLDELREDKQEVMRKLWAMEDDHEKEIMFLKYDLKDNLDIRKSMAKKIDDLLNKVERVQKEHITEWAKRDRIESEKLNLERENKKLKSEITDIQERLEKKGSLRSLNSSDLESRHAQPLELYEKNKEPADIKHSYLKLKKVLHEKTIELSHALRRAEQYENEDKKLRARVEELKYDLTTMEDELDAVSSHSKKLQRTNEELQEQVDNFQIQLQHLHVRLHSYSNSSLVSSQKDMGISHHSGSDFDDQNEYF